MIPALIVGVAIAAVFVGIYGYNASQQSGGDNSETTDSAPSEVLPMNPMETINPVDQSTWPSGDKLWMIAQAIACAEGYGVSPLNGPTRNCNPGDISDFSGSYGYDPMITDSKVTKFPDHQTGWNALHWKLDNMATGNSRVYSTTMTWREFSLKWQTKPGSSWVNTVTGRLGVSPDSRIEDYLV